MSNTDRIRAYYNLHRKCFSVQDYQSGLVIEHTYQLFVTNAMFVVRESGNKKVKREGRKNVPAVAHGDIAPMAWHQEFRPDLKRVLYNPYKAPTFRWEHKPEESVNESKCVLLNNDGRMYAVSTTE